MNQRREAGMAVCNAPLPQKKMGYQGVSYNILTVASQIAIMTANIKKNCDYLGISPEDKLRELDIIYILNRVLGQLNSLNQLITDNRSL